MCVECGTRADAEARAWRAYRTDTFWTEAELDVAFYCPRCALEQFGPPRSRPLDSWAPEPD